MIFAEERQPSTIERCDWGFGLTNGSSSLRRRDDFRFMSSLFYPSVAVRSRDPELIVVSYASNFSGVESFDCDMVAVVPHRHEQSRILFYSWMNRHKHFFWNRDSPLVVDIETLLPAEIGCNAEYQDCSERH